MNNIYKVIWSKAKNCYVVASEIARSHTKSASGSEKIGRGTRRSLLASLMALSLLCGGLGVASAVDSVPVDASTTPGAAEVYTKEKVNDLLDGKANKATTLEGYGITDAYTKNDVYNKHEVYSAEEVAARLNTKANQTALNDQQTAIDKLNDKTAEISHADGGGTNISDVKIKAGNIIGTGNSAITGLANVETNKIKTDSINGKDLTGTTVATDKEMNDEKTARESKDNELDGKITTLDGKVTTGINELKAKDTDLANKIQTNAANIQTNTGNIVATDKRTAGIKRNDTTNETTIENHVTVDSLGNVKAKGNVTADGKLKGNGVDAGTGDITTDGAVNAGSLSVENVSTLKGDVIMDKKLSVTGDTSLKKTDVDGALNVTGESNLQGNVILGKNTANTVTVNGKSDFKEAVEMDNGLTVTSGDTTLKGKLTVTDDAELKNTTVGGKLGVTGETTLGGTLTAEKDATFEKNVTVQKDLTVDGKLNVGEIYLEKNKLDAATGEKHDSATAITADGISNLAKVTEHGNTTESQFTHNKKGTFNHAKDGNTTDWKESTSNVTANGVANKMTDSDGNTHTYYQTATETKEQLTNGDKSNFEKKTAEGNTISIKDKDAAGNDKSLTNKQTVDGEKTSVTNKDSSSTINQGADKISNNVTSVDGTKSSSTEVKADGITNTSKDGTITNDAKDIVNNATGNMTNTVGGKQTNKIDGNQENTIGGNQTTNVTGDISNTAKNITNKADEKLTDQVGDNTRVTTSDSITDTVGTANRKIENDKITDTAGDSTVTTENGKGTTFAKTGSAVYSTDAGAPTDTNIAGNHITTGRVDANELAVSDKDGANTADLSVKAGEGVKASASNGTITGSLDVTAEEVGSSVTDASGKGSTFKQRIDAIMGNVKTDAGESEVTQKGDEITSKVGIGEATNSRVTQKKGSLEAAVTDGTNTNVSYDTANASAKLLTDGTKENKQQDNLDSSEKTITNGTYKTSKVQTALDITNTAKDGTITNDAKNIVNNASGDMTNTVGGKLTTTVTGATEENYNGGLTTNVTGEENHTVTGKQNNKVTGKQTNTVEGGQENIISGGQINTITGGQINNITGDQTTNVTGDISNTANNITNEAKTELTDKVGTNTRVINSRSITDTVGTKTNRKIEDGKITDTAGDITVTTDEDNGTTFANAGSTASSFTTVDGTNTGSAKRVTNVKGNEISTGKVEANYVKMDYADVMHDLGVHGSAKVDNDLTVGGITTTKTLKVTEDAEVGRDLAVGGNANITGDVTANSYKVGRNTYIDANGINANNQKITNVADGSISEGSKDAVNGGQLYGVKRDLEHQVDKVGANAAAMANLRPMEFDPSSKWNIAAAIGNYGSETAAALGAFYRPNDNVMVNLSTAFGTGENMVGGGVSVRLGKGGNKLSREETNALKAQVNDLTARMDALLSVLNPNMSKDFPDVPENHWAYEAVSRLAGNDIVQGYPDGEFHGERTMTRYEMAEIIYNALSRGAEAERELVEEFKPELQAMAASEKATAERAEG